MHSLILGGARSGKSALAERLARDSGGDVVYVATAQPRDGEMTDRIAHHRAQRPAHWQCVEEPLALAGVLRTQARADRCVLVDCLTLWLSNLLGDPDPGRFPAGARRAAASLAGRRRHRLRARNEVGLGIVPLGELSRRFVDEAGRLHQALGAQCGRVVFVAAGLPLVLKGTPV